MKILITGICGFAANRLAQALRRRMPSLETACFDNLLAAWCQARCGAHLPEADERPRAFYIPWFMMNHDRVHRALGWSPWRGLPSILDEIAEHRQAHLDWLQRCGSL